MVTEIEAVLATVLYSESELAQLRAIFAPAPVICCDPADDGTIASALEYVDVAVLGGDLDDRFVRAPRLRWVHCDHAGLNNSARSEVFERRLIVTGSAGRSAPALAQHAFYFALALVHDVRALLARQAAHRWEPPDSYVTARSLWGKNLGIVGFGNTGREMAALGRAFGMKVTAYRRRMGEPAPSVDRMLSADSGDSLDVLLETSDVVMLATALNNETFHLLGPHQFARMRRDATLINMSRGAVVDESALIDALRTGLIAGAGLDVTEHEPLAVSSPLWTLPNVLITPHSTPPVPDRTERSLRIIAENRDRYLSDQPLLNLLTARDLYTPGVSTDPDVRATAPQQSDGWTP